MAISARIVALCDKIFSGAVIVFSIIGFDFVNTAAIWIVEFHTVGIKHIVTFLALL